MSQMGVSYPERVGSGATMAVMTPAAHAKPVPKHDHLWVLAVVAAAVLAEVWASWVGIGAMSGFPRIDDVPTDWVLAVAVEAYWGYALFAWLAAAPGPRSRTMAMWSCAVVFALSLVSQVSYHELTAPAGATPGRRFVIGFASALPVVILGLIAILVHLRHVDRAEAAEAAERERAAAASAQREAAEVSELDALRAEFATAQEALETAQAERVEAEAKTAEVLAKVEVLTRKLARTSGQKQTRKSSPKTAASTQNKTAASTPEVQVPEDVDTQAAALEILAGEPGISGSELGRRLGKSERYGCMLKNQLTGSIAGPDSGGA